MIKLNKIKGMSGMCLGLLVLIVTQTLRSSAQTAGPSSSQSPYLVPVNSGVRFTSILSANDSINHYKLSGIPDGLGAFDNGDGTFTLLVNHEIVSTLGVVRAHGSIGAFVSKWIINKQDLSVVSGSDLIQSVNLWNGTGYDAYNAANPSSLAAFGRFCSADLPPVSAFYNSQSGNGTPERIYMNGEEVTDGRAMAHIVTGLNGGTSYQLPQMGKMAFENQVANGTEQDKTIVACTDDGAITTSNIYFYVGTKTNTGTEIDKAGLSNGKLYGVKINGYPQERVNSTTINNPPVPGTHFDLVDLGSVAGLTGSQVDAASLAAGATYFSRCEDGAWDPSNLNDFYFNTTDQLDQVNDGIGTQVGRSRVWHLHFTDITNPESGGTVEAVLDGTEGQNMLDNLTIDRSGHIVNLEDVGNAAHNGKIWDYNISTDLLTMIGKHDPARFGDIGVAATAPFTQDEETSGVIDVQALLGPGMFLIDDQAHYTTGIPANIVEGGQLLSFYNPLSSDCNNFTPSVTPGSSTYCHGTQITLRANGGYGFTYQWYKGNATLVGATNATYNVLTKGTYSVVQSNGTCSWASAVTINIIPTPQATIVAGRGLDLCPTGSVPLKAAGSTANSYAWYKDGLVLSGVTTKKIIVSETGNYSLVVTSPGGCSASSSPVTVVQSCKLNDEQDETITSLKLYPNPANGNFIIELNAANTLETTANIQVINMLGQIVYTNQAAISNNRIVQEVKPDASVPAGNYFVRVAIGSKIYTGHIIYQK
ncbi:MAG TPA: T9SS type A sorting domain-containing protein [Chitinophagales bacterium]|nr:T9SS type A sorting domain-containing protein [Chitinophagales bacterium]